MNNFIEDNFNEYAVKLYLKAIEMEELLEEYYKSMQTKFNFPIDYEGFARYLDFLIKEQDLNSYSYGFYVDGRLNKKDKSILLDSSLSFQSRRLVIAKFLVYYLNNGENEHFTIYRHLIANSFDEIYINNILPIILFPPKLTWENLCDLENDHNIKDYRHVLTSFTNQMQIPMLDVEDAFNIVKNVYPIFLATNNESLLLKFKKCDSERLMESLDEKIRQKVKTYGQDIKI